MDKKVTGIVSYITIIGWIIAYLAGDKEGAKFHLNQSLVINIASLINSLLLSKILILIPFIGWIISIIVSLLIFVLWLIGLIAAVKDEAKEVPILGQIKILN